MYEASPWWKSEYDYSLKPIPLLRDGTPQAAKVFTVQAASASGARLTYDLQVFI